LARAHQSADASAEIAKKPRIGLSKTANKNADLDVAEGASPSTKAI